MSDDVVNVWDGVQNTSCWVHDDSSWETDGVVERSAVDIVALAGQAQQDADRAAASADSAAASAESAAGAIAGMMSGDNTFTGTNTFTSQIIGDISGTAGSSLGFADYSADIDYAIGATVKGSDGNLYVALSASGPSTTAIDPVGDTSGKWGLLVPQIGQILTVHGVNGRASVQVDNDMDGEAEDHRVGLESNSFGNAGVYDFTESKWLVWCDKDGINRLSGGTSIYSPDNGTYFIHNLSYVPALDVRDFGAVGDGVTDDYAAIQAALDRAHTTKKTLVIPAGTYLINKHIEFTSDTTVIGYGATILRGYDVDEAGFGSTAWLIRDSAADPVCRNVRIYGLTFDNNCQNYHLNSNNVITIGPLDPKPENNYQYKAENVWFVGCAFQNWINQHALDVAATKGLHVIGCTFRDVLYVDDMVTDMNAWRRWEAIQLDCAGWDFATPLIFDQDWVIEGNTFEAYSGENVTFPAGSQVRERINGEWVYRTIASDKTVSLTAPHTGIGQHSGPDHVNANYTGIRIVNNTFVGCAFAGITLYGVSSSIVSNNIIKNCFYGMEIDARLSYEGNPDTLYRFCTDNVKVINNIFLKTPDDPYYQWSGSTHPFWPGQTIYADCFRVVIYLVDIPEVSVADFTGEKMGAAGIDIGGNTISGFYCGFRSFGLYDSTISKNQINNCKAVWNGCSQNISICDNVVKNGGNGIRFGADMWTYVPNKNNASVNKFVTITGNVLWESVANNMVINVSSNKNNRISNNTFYDETGIVTYTGEYVYIANNSISVITNNAVYAKAARNNIVGVVKNVTGNAARDNDWFVNGVLQ